MLDIERFTKSTKPLEEREQLLFKLIDSLDKESFQLFCETVDLSSDSLYKLPNLANRYKELARIYELTKDAYEYLNRIEESSYTYASKRYVLKYMLASLLAVNTIFLNAIVSIASFVILTKKANKDLLREIEFIDSKMAGFDEEKLRITGITLENCERFIKAKLNNNPDSLDDSIIIANKYISDYIDERVTIEGISILPDYIKTIMLKILQQDLKNQSNSLLELLTIAKSNYTNSQTFIKEY